jgi:8-oxo-dGTP pyrophosphatase MutT (NUDIX family)
MMNMLIQLEDIRKALTLSDFDVPAAQKIMAPQLRSRERPSSLNGNPRVGSVLLLLYCSAGELYFVLTRRRDDLNSHGGQISFPGGRQEPDEPLYATALRETNEEIGVPKTAVSIIGQLTEIYIPPSDFEVHPFVGWYHQNGQPLFTPQANEVAEIIESPLTHLFDPNVRHEEPREFRGHQIMIPFFDVKGHKVWGATAIMLSEFVERLRLVL